MHLLRNATLLFFIFMFFLIILINQLRYLAAPSPSIEIPSVLKSEKFKILPNEYSSVRIFQ